MKNDRETNLSKELLKSESGYSLPDALNESNVTILGYGSLMSEKSARVTFPDLTNFRYVKIRGMKRVFSHPHRFLLSQGLIDPNKTLKLASLSVEPTDNLKDSFVAVAFDVFLNDEQRRDFVEREEEYKIINYPYYSLQSSDHNENNVPIGKGVICVASTVDMDHYTIHESIKGRGGIWHWTKDSGLQPANIYLRHCLMSLEKVGGIAYDSFLHDSYLVDRKTSLYSYLNEDNIKEEVMLSEPPKHLTKRFGG